MKKADPQKAEGWRQHIPHEPVITSVNRWSCTTINGKLNIDFDGWVFGTDFSNTVPGNFRETLVYWNTYVDKYKSKVRIRLPMDYYSYYVKEDES